MVIPPKKAITVLKGVNGHKALYPRTDTSSAGPNGMKVANPAIISTIETNLSSSLFNRCSFIIPPVIIILK
jgi:hypothetical protein